MRTLLTTLCAAVALGGFSLTATLPAAALPAVTSLAYSPATEPTLVTYYGHHGHYRHYGHHRYYRSYGGYGYDYPRYRSYGYYGGPGISFSIGPRYGFGHYGYSRYGHGW